MVDVENGKIWKLSSHSGHDNSDKVHTVNKKNDSLCQKKISSVSHCGDHINGNDNEDPGYLIEASTVDVGDVAIRVRASSKGLRKPFRRSGKESTWEVPHRLSKDDAVASAGTKFFIMFIHPDAYEMSRSCPALWNAITESGFKSLKERYGICVSRSQAAGNNGMEVTEATGTDDEMSANDEPVDTAQVESTKKSRRSRARRKNRKNNHVVPEYDISYPGDSSNVLEVAVKLPLLVSFSSVSVNVQEKRLIITTSKEPVVYRLDLDLSDSVNRSGKQVMFLIIVFTYCLFSIALE